MKGRNGRENRDQGHCDAVWRFHRVPPLHSRAVQIYSFVLRVWRQLKLFGHFRVSFLFPSSCSSLQAVCSGSQAVWVCKPHTGSDPCLCFLHTALVPGTHAASLPVQDRTDESLRDYCFPAVVIELCATAVSNNCEFNSLSAWEMWTSMGEMGWGFQCCNVLPT